MNYTIQCTVDHCRTNPVALGLCSKHYQRKLKYGNPTYYPITINYKKRRNKIVVKRWCKIKPCRGLSETRGMCEKHYTRYMKYGDPNKVLKVVGEERTKHPLYKAYHGMLDRCYNPNNTHYKYYGGRGIGMADEWRGLGGFRQFIKDMGMRPSGCTLDRTDNDKGYSKDNCRWTNKSAQQLNQRTPFTNSSGHKGIHKFKATGRWQAYIGIKGKRKHLGYFADIESAIEARDKAEAQLKEN